MVSVLTDAADAVLLVSVRRHIVAPKLHTNEKKFRFLNLSIAGTSSPVYTILSGSKTAFSV